MFITLHGHGYGLVYHAMCLFTPQAFCRVLIPAYPQRAGLGGVGLAAWFCIEVVYPSKGGHPPTD